MDEDRWGPLTLPSPPCGGEGAEDRYAASGLLRSFGLEFGAHGGGVDAVSAGDFGAAEDAGVDQSCVGEALAGAVSVDELREGEVGLNLVEEVLREVAEADGFGHDPAPEETELGGEELLLGLEELHGGAFGHHGAGEVGVGGV